MLSPSNPAYRHQQVDALVRRWLQERQQLIVQMMALSQQPEDEAGLQRFCETLMDYVSAGHFEIYDELLAEAELEDSPHLSDGRALLQRLTPTTDAAIRFNDIFDGPDGDDMVHLPHELSQLGMALESRFEIEDRMISLLHERTGSPV